MCCVVSVDRVPKRASPMTTDSSTKFQMTWVAVTLVEVVETADLWTNFATTADHTASTPARGVPRGFRWLSSAALDSAFRSEFAATWVLPCFKWRVTPLDGRSLPSWVPFIRISRLLWYVCPYVKITNLHFPLFIYNRVCTWSGRKST